MRAGVCQRPLPRAAVYVRGAIVANNFSDGGRLEHTAVDSRSKDGNLWTFTKHLEDVDFADDISLLFNRQQHALVKLSRVVAQTEKTGLIIKHWKDRGTADQQPATRPSENTSERH